MVERDEIRVLHDLPELNYITDQEIYLFTKMCLTRAPEYFWEVPSSSTGHYHPVDEFTKGGLVLHTRRSVSVAHDLCTAFNIVGTDKDCVVSAMLNHDVCKQGYPRDTGATITAHGALWSQFIYDLFGREYIRSIPFVMKIADLVAHHMGVFDVPYESGPTPLHLVVQTADYIVTRRYIDVRLE